MKIAILGTRGIPNSYGGFEQFAEYLSAGLVERGHSVTVYNTSFHEYNKGEYKGVNIRKIYSPEKTIGASANFIYDYLCLKDALKQNFDIIYEAGYHSNAPSYYLLKPQSPIVITNMDGIEWKRSKWSGLTQKLIKWLEKIAVEKTDYMVSDNKGIQQYYKDQFNKESFFIPYGADLIENFDSLFLAAYNIQPNRYYLLIARIEPENNIEMILDGYTSSSSNFPFVVVGNHNNKYGRYLLEKYKNKNNNVIFAGGIYCKHTLDNLRHFSSIYFHGHSVGGTNPSLLEAMAAQTFVAAHDNIFNKSVLNANALYFTKSNEVTEIINAPNLPEKTRTLFIENNYQTIGQQYSWNNIISQYESLFERLIAKRKQARTQH